MKVLKVLLGISFVASFANASDIELEPGASIELRASEETTQVTCKRSQSRKPVCKIVKDGYGPNQLEIGGFRVREYTLHQGTDVQTADLSRLERVGACIALYPR